MESSAALRPPIADESHSAAPEQRQAEAFLSVPLLKLFTGVELPGDLYVCVAQKMMHYRRPGDRISEADFNKLLSSHVQYVFIDDRDREKYAQWMAEKSKDWRLLKTYQEWCAKQQNASAETPPPQQAQPETSDSPPAAQQNKEDVLQVIEAVESQKRSAMDLFRSPKDDKAVRETIARTKEMARQLLAKPFAAKNIVALQRHSKGLFDHSVNVSLLSVYLALNLGYTHKLILEDVAVGGLFHDIGKLLLRSQALSVVDRAAVEVADDDSPAMWRHPELSVKYLEGLPGVSNEVLLMLGQHHERMDGSGYPSGLKSLAIYDLARIIAIADTYDTLVSKSTASTLTERATIALAQLERDYAGKLERMKLEKSCKVLRFSLL